MSHVAKNRLFTQYYAQYPQHKQKLIMDDSLFMLLLELALTDPILGGSSTLVCLTQWMSTLKKWDVQGGMSCHPKL